MKFTLCLLVGLFAAALAFNPVRKIEFQPGKTYIYDYQTQLTTGIPELAQQYAGLVLKSKLVLRPLDNERVWMKLDEVRVGKQNDLRTDAKDLHLAAHVQEDLNVQLSKPIEFRYIDGLVKSFRAANEEPEWSLNLKKAVLSLLNVDLQPKKVIKSHIQQTTERPADVSQLVYYGVYENTVAGHCEAYYQIQQTVDPRVEDVAEEAVLNVTKVFNYGHCIEEPTIVDANLESQGCDSYCTFRKHARQNAEDVHLKGYHMVEEDAQNKPKFVKYACDCSILDLEMPVDQFTTIKYNISQEDKIFESIHADGQVVLNKEAEQMSVATVAILNLIEITENYEQSTSDRQHHQALQDAQMHEKLIFRLDTQAEDLNMDMPYYHLFKFPSQEKLVQHLKHSINEVVEEVLAGHELKSKHTMHRILAIIDQLAVLKEQYLQQLFSHYVLRSVEHSAKEATARKIFLDVLTLSGSNQCAQLIAKAIVQKQLSHTEIQEVLEAMPTNMYMPTKHTIDQYIQLLEEQVFGQNKQLRTVLAVTAGKLIKKGCYAGKTGVFAKHTVGHPRALNTQYQQQQQKQHCQEAHVEEYVRLFTKHLNQATQYTEKAAYVETLAQIAHPKVLLALQPYVTGQISGHRCPGYEVTHPSAIREECDFLRTHILYALHQFSAIYPAQVRALAMPIYRDVSESHEVRIAALSLIMFSNPTKYELQTVANSLRHENNRQMIAMTYGYLREMSQLEHPKQQDMAAIAQEIISSLSEPKYTQSGYSKISLNDFIHPIRKDGVFLNHLHISANDTIIPSAFYLAAGRVLPTSFKNQAWLIYQQKGFEKFIDSQYVKWMNSFGSEWMSMVPKVLRSSTQSEQTERILNELRSKLNIALRGQNDFKLRLSYKLFDNAGFQVFDEMLLRQKLEQFVSQAVEVAQKLSRGQTVQFVKIFMPTNYNKMIVTELGMPVLVRQRQPLLVALKLKAVQSEMNEATSAQVALHLHPILATIKATEMITPFTKLASGKQIGAKVIKQTYFTLPMQVILRLKPFEKTLMVSVVPEKKHDILVHEIRPVTFVKTNTLFWETIEQHHQGEKMIRVYQKPYKTEKVFGDELFGHGIAMNWYRDMPAMAAYEQEKKFADVFCWKDQLQRLLSLYLSPSAGYQLMKLSLDSNVQQPAFDFALAYQNFANFEQYTDQESYERTVGTGNDQEYDELEMTSESRTYNQWIRYDTEYESVVEYGQNRYQAQEKMQRILAKLTFNKELMAEQINQLIRRTAGQWKPNREHDRKPAVLVHNFVLVALTNGAVWKQVGFNTLYAHTLDRQINWLKTDGFVRFAETFTGAQEQHQHFCTEMVLSYPKMLDLFRFRPAIEAENTEQQSSPAKAMLRTYFGWGKRTCNEGKIVINGKFEHHHQDKVFRKTQFESAALKEYQIYEEEQREFDGQQQPQWFFKQCIEDQKHGKKASVACELAIEEHTKLNQLVLDIQYEKVPVEIRNLTRKFEMFLKAKYWQQMDNNAEQVENEPNRVRIVGHYSEKMMGIPMVNFHIQKPTEETYFKHIIAPFKTSSYLVKKTHEHTEDRCMIVGRNVRTFDNVTYNMPDTSCKYLLSMDCSEQQRFAVYSEKHQNAKVYTVLVRGKMIKILPIDQQSKTIKIIIDGQNEYHVSLERPFVYGDLRVYQRHVSHSAGNQITKMLVVEVPAELKIITDSHNIIIDTNPRFIGKVCGLCGNKDYEAEQEFEGANQCEYKRVTDFVHSYAVRSEGCNVPEVRGPMRCIKSHAQRQQWQKWQSYRRQDTSAIDEVDEAADEATEEEGCEYKKTAVVYRDQQVCFSKYPIKACRDSCQPAEEVTKRISYVCYPRSDSHTQQLIQDASVRVLYELKSLRTAFEKTLEVPATCA